MFYFFNKYDMLKRAKMNFEEDIAMSLSEISNKGQLILPEKLDRSVIFAEQAL